MTDLSFSPTNRTEVDCSPGDELHILILPSFYHDPEKPILGIFFKDQAAALQQAGVKVRIVYQEGRRLQALRLSALPQNHFQVKTRSEDGLLTMRQHGWNTLAQTTRGGLLWAWLTQRLVRRYVQQFGKPDIIHAHNTLWAGYAARKAAHEHGVPYLVTEHSTAFPTQAVPRSAQRYVREVLRDASEVITVSQALARAMQNYLAGRQAVVVPNVVHTDYFTLPPVEPAPRPFQFLTVAKLFPKKGIHVLLRAFAHRFRHEPEANLCIAGEGPLRQELEALRNELELQSNVRFLGELSREEVRLAMWRSHAFVLPSLHETFGVVVIEALATGLPVIATRCGGPEEILTSQTGLLLESGDENGLVNALDYMWDHSAEYSRQALRDHAVRYYGPATIAATLKNIYSDLICRNKVD